MTSSCCRMLDIDLVQVMASVNGGGHDGGVLASRQADAYSVQSYSSDHSSWSDDAGTYIAVDDVRDNPGSYRSMKDSGAYRSSGERGGYGSLEDTGAYMSADAVAHCLSLQDGLADGYFVSESFEAMLSGLVRAAESRGVEAAATSRPGVEDTLTSHPGSEAAATSRPGVEDTLTSRPGSEASVTSRPGSEESTRQLPPFCSLTKTPSPAETLALLSTAGYERDADTDHSLTSHNGRGQSPSDDVQIKVEDMDDGYWACGEQKSAAPAPARRPRVQRAKSDTAPGKLKFSPHVLPPCRVCAAQATGYHYGANTCEPCKVKLTSFSIDRLIHLPNKGFNPA